MYYIELASGLRRGELLGLKWQDIDWKNGIIVTTSAQMEAAQTMGNVLSM